MMTTVMASVAVWTNERGVPEGLVWDQRRFRSTDTPTLLESDYEFIAMHPPAVHPGWRLQGTDDHGRSMIFDVRYISSRCEWILVRVYD